MSNHHSRPISPRPISPAAMAKSSALAALLAVALVLASLCVACNAARIVPEQGRKLIVASDLTAGADFVVTAVTGTYTFVMDLTKVGSSFQPGTISTMPTTTLTSEGTMGTMTTSSTSGGQASCKLVPGQVTELRLVQVVAQDLGVVHLLLDFAGVKKVIDLDLTKLPVLVVDGVLHKVLVFVYDTVNNVLHLQNQLGQCLADVTGGSFGGSVTLGGTSTVTINFP